MSQNMPHRISRRRSRLNHELKQNRRGRHDASERWPRWACIASMQGLRMNVNKKARALTQPTLFFERAEGSKALDRCWNRWRNREYPPALAVAWFRLSGFGVLATGYGLSSPCDGGRYLEEGHAHDHFFLERSIRPVHLCSYHIYPRGVRLIDYLCGPLRFTCFDERSCT